MQHIAPLRNWLVLSGIVAATGCGSSGSGTDITCGSGTTLVGDTCEAGSGGSGDVCGAGTHVDTDGVTCVPDGPAASGAPTITMMDPTDAGFTGFDLFTITGTGFAGADITSLTVYFGDTTNTDCQATVGAATATTIAGEIPGDCSLAVSVDVTVTTNLGSATTPFVYDAIFAADGDGGGSIGAGGDVYIIDPLAELSFDLGPLLEDDGMTGYGIAGLAFAADGTLFAVTTGDSPADDPEDFVSQLVTISLVDGSVTVIGNTVHGATDYVVSGLSFSGTTLYGWAQTNDFAKESLVTIDQGTGALTLAGTALTDAFPWGALAVDGGGNVFVAANGAAADDAIGTSGEFDSVDTGTGALTSAATLDLTDDQGNPLGAPIESMAYFGTNLLAVVDYGTYGAITGNGMVGEQLALIDPMPDAGDPVVSPLFELSAQIGAQSHIGGITLAPPTLSVIARKIPSRDQWQHLGAARVPAKH